MKTCTLCNIAEAFRFAAIFFGECLINFNSLWLFVSLGIYVYAGGHTRAYIIYTRLHRDSQSKRKIYKIIRNEKGRKKQPNKNVLTTVIYSIMLGGYAFLTLLFFVHTTLLFSFSSGSIERDKKRPDLPGVFFSLFCALLWQKLTTFTKP